jgi:exodeoxyribonuclease V alpha subunit
MNAPVAATSGLRAFDRMLAEWVQKRSGSAALARAAGAASAAEGQGHACAQLGGDDGQAGEDAAALRRHPWVGDGARFTPFVLDDRNRFYTWRMHHHEAALADAILARCAGRSLPVAVDVLRDDLAQLFADAEPIGSKDQRSAVAALPGSRLFVLTGGPGTGKTTTAMRMLLMLLRHAVACGLPPAPVVALCAPTGKAAQRLAQSVRDGAAHLARALPANSRFRVLLDRVTAPGAGTLHALLGYRPHENSFARGIDDPLAADIVLVDEASMVDLASMRCLFDALRPHAVLILLGDPDQLYSVDSGSVLSDIVRAGQPGRLPPRLARHIAPLLLESPAVAEASHALAGQVMALRHGWRANHGLAVALEALRGNDAQWLDALARGAAPDGFELAVCADAAALRVRVEHWIDGHADVFGALLQGGDGGVAGPGLAFESLRKAQILCALREGTFGATGINALIERRLAARFGFDAMRDWYHGRVVIVTRNAPARGLFNGDVGIALEGAAGLRVWFGPGADAAADAWRDFPPRMLPDCETAWAITIHRSQGSEYDEVAVVLPPDPASRVLSRELVYTAASRARRRVSLWATGDSLRAALDRRITRQGGLLDRLVDAD